MNSINTSASGVRIPDATTGQTYYYDFTTLNPTAISSSNSVTLVGRYRSAEGNNRIEFGTLSGSATLVGGGLTTSDPGNPSAQYFSPFALAYSFTPTVTTTLDETGLVTPKVSVTDGINMNGSKITNLAPGTDPGDAVNRAQMDAEADARIAADALLTQQYNEVAASGAAETSQRIAADNALGARLSVVEGSLATVDARLGKLDQQIASSTAIATAMSGNAFLPDMKFNLTGNLATYDGAYAGSLQMGAMVSRRAAINAGIAKGFNKNGKTAARVGLTVGW